MRICEIITEEIAWQSSLSKKIFSLGFAPDADYGTSHLWIPLTPGMLKRVASENPRERVFHVTSEKYVQAMLQGQGKKRSISAFFNMDSHGFHHGIQGGGGFVFELDAEILGAFDEDVMSAPDKSGARWITLHYLVRASGFMHGGKLKMLHEEMRQLIDRLYMQYRSRDPNFDPDDYTDTTSWESVDRWLSLGTALKRADDNQTLYRLIKGYIDGVYEIFQRHSDAVVDSLRNYLLQRSTEESWDEIVVNNYKILGVHMRDQEAEAEKFQDTIQYLKDNKIPIKVWDSYESLQNYTDSVAAKQKTNK